MILFQSVYMQIDVCIYKIWLTPTPFDRSRWFFLLSRFIIMTTILCDDEPYLDTPSLSLKCNTKNKTIAIWWQFYNLRVVASRVGTRKCSIIMLWYSSMLCYHTMLFITKLSVSESSSSGANSCLVNYWRGVRTDYHWAFIAFIL